MGVRTCRSRWTPRTSQAPTRPATSSSRSSPRGGSRSAGKTTCTPCSAARAAGRLRVLRSQLGRADPALAEKAARLAGVTLAQFRAGPQPQAAPAPPGAGRTGRAARRKPAARDSVTSLVLALHAEADRPLGFDQVVELSGNRVTRAQVSAASSALCRDGQLDRIRSGVYQWSAGQRATRRIPAARRAGETLPQQAPRPRNRPAPQPARLGTCPRPDCSASSSRPASR